MMIVILPALSASRTSIHVISSSQIVFGVAIGFGVSEQLYSFPALPRPRPRPALSARGTRGHVPPPMLWTPLGAPACDGFCAAAVDSAKNAAQQAIAVFMVSLPPQGDLTSRPTNSSESNVGSYGEDRKPHIVIPSAARDLLFDWMKSRSLASGSG